MTSTTSSPCKATSRRKVATALPGGLKREKPPIPELAKPRETEAYLLYLQGQALMWKTDEDSLRRSLEFFKKALQTDPTFARAHAGMARAYAGLGSEDFMSWLDACNLGRAAAEKAIAIDPGLAEAHALRAEIAFMADETADVRRPRSTKGARVEPQLGSGAYHIGGSSWAPSA